MLDEVTLSNCIKQAVRLKLAGYELLLCHTIPEILRCANGIGPEAFPECITKAIDTLNPSLVVVSVIHDLRFTFGNGTRADFLQANADFEINGSIVADDNYGWYNPARYVVKFNAHEFRKTCDKFGWPAYCEAIAIRKQDPIFKDRHVEMVLI